MISSAASTAWGFSILAISGSRVWRRTVVTSSAVRTNDSATMSTPIDSPKRSMSRSSSGTAARPRVEPGMLRPWRDGDRAADLDRGVDLAVAGADRA